MHWGFPYRIQMTFLLFSSQSCPFSTIPAPSFFSSFFVTSSFSSLETLFCSCQCGGFLWRSDCKQKTTQPMPHSAFTENADRYSTAWLIYLYRAIDFILLSMNQKVASDYWLVNLHVFYHHCISQLQWFLFLTDLSTRTQTKNAQLSVFFSQTQIFTYIILTSSIYTSNIYLVLNGFVLRIWTHYVFIDRFSNTVHQLEVIIPIPQNGKWKQQRSKGFLQRETEVWWQSMEHSDFVALTCALLATRSVKTGNPFYKIVQFVNSSGSLPQVSDVSLYVIQASVSN